jgi:hypothetical protein
LRVLADGSDLRTQKIGFVSQKRRRFSPFLLWRLSKAHTGPVTVLVNELDADVRSRASSFLFGRLPKPKAGSAAVLRNELNARSFEGASYII